MRSNRSSLYAACALVVTVCGAGVAHAAPIFQVSLDTTTLVGQGTFALDFQLVDGSGGGDASTIVALSDFGGAYDEPGDFTGDASGDVSKVVSLHDSVFFSAFTIGFAPGGTLTFQMRATTTSSGLPFPDLFSLSLLQLTLPDGTPTSSSSPLLDFEVVSGGRLQVYGVPAVLVDAPHVSQVPEPGVLLLVPVAAMGFKRFAAAWRQTT